MRNYKENECGCQECVDMCIDSPCLATPEDILKLIENGYGDRLMMGFITPQNHEDIEAIIPARKGWEGTDGGAYYNSETSCTFLDEKGLCELHNLKLKPLGGRIASHGKAPNDTFDTYISILTQWESPEGFRAKKRWSKQFVKRDLVKEFVESY